MRFSRSKSQGTKTEQIADRARLQLTVLEADVRTLAPAYLISASLKNLRAYGKDLLKLAGRGELAELGDALTLSEQLAVLHNLLTDDQGKAYGGKRLADLYADTALAFINAYDTVARLGGATVTKVSY